MNHDMSMLQKNFFQIRKILISHWFATNRHTNMPRISGFKRLFKTNTYPSGLKDDLVQGELNSLQGSLHQRHVDSRAFAL